MKNVIATILLGLTLASCGQNGGNLNKAATGFTKSLHHIGNEPNINLGIPGVLNGSIETDEHGEELTFVFRYFNQMHMDTLPLAEWNELADEGSCDAIKDIKPLEFINLTDTIIEVECLDGSASYMYLDTLIDVTNSQKHFSVKKLKSGNIIPITRLDGVKVSKGSNTLAVEFKIERYGVAGDGAFVRLGYEITGPNNGDNIKAGVIYFIVNDHNDLQNLWLNMTTYGVNLAIMKNGVEQDDLRFTYSGPNKTMIDLR